jgi:ribosomal protein L16/L10AE
MGKGKGKYVCTIGTILRNEIFLELSVVDFWKNGSFIYSAISKLPIRIQLVFKRQNPHESYILEPFDTI